MKISSVKRTISFLISGIFLFIGYPVLLAQSDTISAVVNTDGEELVRNVFLGGGECFEVFNIELSGQAGQAGVFTNGMSSIGFSDGIILSNGNVEDISGPNLGYGFADADLSTGYGVTSSDEDLETLSAQEGDNNPNFFDPVILEFDFTPTLDSISFDFVFASEEYCEFSLSTFIDLFGFFISGPGISGPYTDNGINIATVPGTSQAITALNISPFFNSVYYQNNIPPGEVGCSLGESAPASDFIAFDGFTVPLTASARVIPCETYHIRLVVSDRGFDDELDAAVFLRANSFAAGLTSRIASEVNGPSQGNDAPYEGCGAASIIFSRGDSIITDDLVVHYDLLPNSTATPGVDYAALPDSVIIPAGFYSDTIFVEFFQDNIPEGIEFFTVKLTNPCSCSESELTINIHEFPSLQVDIVGPDQICDGEAVALAAVPSGGIGTISYEWSNGDLDSLFNFTPAMTDTYQVIVTDECGSRDTVQQTVRTISPMGSIEGNDVICDGRPPVSFPIILEDGGIFSFDVFENGIPTTYTNIVADTFFLPVTTTGVYELGNLSADGCPGEVEGEAQLLAVEIVTSAQIDSIECFGDADAIIDLHPVGGTGVYDYDWSHQMNLNAAQVTDLDTGTYTAFINDSNGCLDTISVTIDQPTIVEAAIDTIELFANCLGNGGLQGLADGGLAPYEFSWSDGNNTALNTDLGAGNYTLSVTDANGCLMEYSTAILSDSIPPLVSIEALDSLDCVVDLIQLDAGNSSQNGDFSFSWTNSSGTPLMPTDPLLVDITAADTYTLSITNNDNGCSSADSIIVEDFATVLDVAISGAQDLSCNTDSIELELINSMPEWEANWQLIDGTLLAANTTNFVVSAEGTYELVVNQNSTGCVGRDTVVINADLTAPLLSLNNVPDSLDCAATPVAIDVDIANGSGNYEYLWTGPAGGITTDPMLQDISASEPGIYQLIAEDINNGCQDTLAYELFENLSTLVINPIPDTTLSCATDIIELTATSPSPGNLSFEWFNAMGSSISQSATVEISAAETYTVSVTNNDNNCVESAIVEVGSDMIAPILSLDTPPDSLDCDILLVTIDAAISNGSGNYEYLWTGPSGGIDSDPMLQDIDAVEPGIYQLIAEDINNGCRDTISVEIFEDITTLIINPIADTTLSCAINSINLTASSPNTGNLSFEWFNPMGMSVSQAAAAQITTPGTYTVSVTNTDNNCVQSTTVQVAADTVPPSVVALLPENINCEQSTVDLSIVPGPDHYALVWRNALGEVLPGTDWTQNVDQAGGYILTITDEQNGCRSSVIFDVRIDTIPPELGIGLVDTLTCAVNNVGLVPFISNGSGNYSYHWDGPAGGIIGPDDELSATVEAAGNYMLILTDSSNFCTDTLEVPVFENQLSPQLAGINDTLINCFQPSVILLANSSSSSALTYEWQNELGLAISTDSTAMIDTSGEYELEITDTGNGCSTTTDFTVLADFTEPIAEAGEDAVIDCGNESVTLSATEGSTNWVPSWSDGNGMIISTGSWTLMTTTPDNYQLSVLDTLNGCTATDMALVTISQTIPIANAGPDQTIDCFTYTATVSAENSTQGDHILYQILDENNLLLFESQEPVFTITEAGNYQLLVINTENDCEALDNFLIINDEPNLNAISVVDIACNETFGSITFSEISNGTPPFLYSIDGGGSFLNTDYFPNLEDGNYELVVQDALGCETQANASIHAADEVIVFLEEQLTLKVGEEFTLAPQINRQLSDISSIVWTNSAQLDCTDCLNPVFTALETTHLEISITDNNGCIGTAQILIVVDERVPVFIPNVFSPNDKNGTNDHFTIYGDPSQIAGINQLRIFDRWGGLVFSKDDFPVNDPQHGWDGRKDGQLYNPGVFVYWVEVLLFNGKTVIMEGDILLMD